MRHEIRDTVEFPGFSKFPEFLEGFLANEDIKKFWMSEGGKPNDTCGDSYTNPI
jgi:hypothetical protein